MTKSAMHYVARVVGSGIKRTSAVLETVGGKHAKVGLIAAVLFILAYAVETKAMLALESSQDLFPSHAQVTVGVMYR